MKHWLISIIFGRQNPETIWRKIL